MGVAEEAEKTVTGTVDASCDDDLHAGEEVKCGDWGLSSRSSSR